jgi:hypothetical protein
MNQRLRALDDDLGFVNPSISSISFSVELNANGRTLVEEIANDVMVSYESVVSFYISTRTSKSQ